MRSLWICAFAGLIGPQPMRVSINLPAYRLDAYVGDSLVRSMPIAPGMPRFRSPRGEFAITSVEWNPWWIPPDSKWAAKEKATPPGAGNPMGRVKLNFRPLYFLHGTPFEQSIGTAASHGCIRLKNNDAIDLARLVHRFGATTLAADATERIATDTATTRTVVLDEPVPLEIRYDLAEVRDGRVMVYRDIYHLATRPLRAEVYAALAARGIDTTSVDAATLTALVRRIGSAGKSVALDSLVRRP